VYDLLIDHIIAGIKVELEVEYMVSFVHWVHFRGLRGYFRNDRLIFCLDRKGNFCIRRPNANKLVILSETDIANIERVESVEVYDARVKEERRIREEEWQKRMEEIRAENARIRDAENAQRIVDNGGTP
jgi:hypothetical protein